MAQSRQTPRVWSDAIRGSEILSNWVKLGTSAVLLWLSIGIAMGAAVGAVWFLEGTTSLDRTLWVHHARNSLGVGGRIADLPSPKGNGTRIQVSKDQVRRYTWRSYQIVSRRFEESVFLGVLIAVGGAVTSGFFLRQSGRSATEDRHIRGATLAPIEAVIAAAKASRLPYDFTLAGVPLFRDAETDHVLVCGAPGSGKGVAIKELLDQIRARGDCAILYDPSGEYVQVYYRHGKDVLLNPLDARSPSWTLYDAVAASYRQTVLTGFQEVEDNLAAFRILEQEAGVQDDAVKAAERSVALTTDQYKVGIVSYLNVVTAQAFALSDQRTAVDIATRRMTSSVLLVKALGGLERIAAAFGRGSGIHHQYPQVSAAKESIVLQSTHFLLPRSKN